MNDPPDVQEMMIEIRGTRYHVEVSGEGSPILLLHGFAGSLRSWDGLRETLVGRHRTIAVDLPGHGRTQRDPGGRDPTLRDVAVDLVSMLDELGIERADLLGYSMGGRLALQLATGLPGTVRSLILESASFGIEEAAERAARERKDRQLADWIIANDISTFVNMWERMPLFATQSALPEKAWAEQRHMRLKQHPAGLASSLRGMGSGAQECLSGLLPGLSMKVLLITGELDTRYTGIADRMAEEIPDSTSIRIPGAGHNVHLERPEDFSAEVARFLALAEQT